MEIARCGPGSIWLASGGIGGPYPAIQRHAKPAKPWLPWRLKAKTGRFIETAPVFVTVRPAAMPVTERQIVSLAR